MGFQNCTESFEYRFKGPYEKSVLEFSKIHTCRTASDKLKCLSNVERAIREETNPSSSLSNYHLLRIFTWIILKANVPCLHSEVNFIDKFIPSSIDEMDLPYYLFGMKLFQYFILFFFTTHKQKSEIKGIKSQFLHLKFGVSLEQLKIASSLHFVECNI